MVDQSLWYTYKVEWQTPRLVLALAEVCKFRHDNLLALASSLLVAYDFLACPLCRLGDHEVLGEVLRWKLPPFL